MIYEFITRFDRLIYNVLTTAANINGNHSPIPSVNVKTSSSPPPQPPLPSLPSLPTPQHQSSSHLTQRSLSNSDHIGSKISKLKRFLTTLYQFANDISTDTGERVRALIIGLVVSFLYFIIFWFLFYFNQRKY
jgi:hypothetical protein